MKKRTKVTPPQMRRLTQGEKDDIIVRYMNGAPNTELKKQYGVTDAFIRRLVKDRAAAQRLKYLPRMPQRLDEREPVQPPEPSYIWMVAHEAKVLLQPAHVYLGCGNGQSGTHVVESFLPAQREAALARIEVLLVSDAARDVRLYRALLVPLEVRAKLK